MNKLIAVLLVTGWSCVGQLTITGLGGPWGYWDDGSYVGEVSDTWTIGSPWGANVLAVDAGDLQAWESSVGVLGSDLVSMEWTGSSWTAQYFGAGYDMAAGSGGAYWYGEGEASSFNLATESGGVFEPRSVPEPDIATFFASAPLPDGSGWVTALFAVLVSAVGLGLGILGLRWVVGKLRAVRRV